MDVYATLYAVLLAMGLSAFCFARVLAIILLRRRFAAKQPRSPLQATLRTGLQIALGCLGGVWLFLFGTGATAVAKATMNGDFLPLVLFPMVILIGSVWLVVVFRVSLRARSQDLEQLAAEIQACALARARSDQQYNGSRPQGGETAESLVPVTPGTPHDTLEHQHRENDQGCKRTARQAVLFLGEPSYQVLLEMLQKGKTSVKL